MRIIRKEYPNPQFERFRTENEFKREVLDFLDIKILLRASFSKNEALA